MRSIAQQTEAELGGSMSILVRQKRDHVRLDQLLEQVQRASGEEQDRTWREIGRLVFPHAFAEESVLWPTLRRVLPDGEQLTLTVEQEHQEINELWTQLERGAAGADREAMVERLVALLREDVRDEEDQLLPRLQERLSHRQLRRLGVAWEAVRRTAPTRPHPVVSRRPPGNVLSALPLTVLDRSRDTLDAVARRTPAQVEGVLLRGGDVLGRVSDRLDRVAPFRRGEHPSTSRSAADGTADGPTGSAGR